MLVFKLFKDFVGFFIKNDSYSILCYYSISQAAFGHIFMLQCTLKIILETFSEILVSFTQFLLNTALCGLLFQSYPQIISRWQNMCICIHTVS